LTGVRFERDSQKRICNFCVNFASALVAVVVVSSRLRELSWACVLSRQTGRNVIYPACMVCRALGARGVPLRVQCMLDNCLETSRLRRWMSVRVVVQYGTLA